MPYTGMIITIQSGFVTNAAVLTITAHAILAAPGAGLCYRIAWITASYDPDNAIPGTILRLKFVAGAGGVTPATLNISPDSPYAGIVFPEPGISLNNIPGGIGTGVNAAFNVDSKCSNIKQEFETTVAYMIDKIT